MESRLYVGNLSFKTTEEGLRQVFGRDGRQVVDCKIIMDRETGRSRGFGFVEMGSKDDADKAVAALDGVEIDGRALRVNIAREKQPRGRSNDRY